MTVMHQATPAQDIYLRFKREYQLKGTLSARQLSDLYADNAVFMDPVHELRGLAALQDYFHNIGKNVIQCRFEFVDELVTSQQAHVTWKMHLRHKKLAGKKTIILRGMSLIKMQDNKIIYHEDCYDLGALLYENLPLLGTTTRWLKKQLAG